MISTRIKLTPQTATRLNKALAALAIAAFSVAAITVFPDIGPGTPANAAPVAIKGDKLNVAAAEPSCAAQNWPNFDSSCLRRSETSGAVKQVRQVTTDRL